MQATTPERLAALDEVLWTYSDASFLAHGSARDGDEAMHPVWLTTGDDNPNAAVFRIFVAGAPPEPGRDDEALATARAQFRSLKTAGHSLSYWRQSADGLWEQQA